MANLAVTYASGSQPYLCSQLNNMALGPLDVTSRYVAAADATFGGGCAVDLNGTAANVHVDVYPAALVSALLGTCATNAHGVDAVSTVFSQVPTLTLGLASDVAKSQ